MNLPFTLPDWLPAWAFLLLAIPALLFLLAFALMPFSVFGVKARLESIEAQLDAVREELHNLSFRTQGGGRAYTDDSEPFDPLPNFSNLKSARQSYTERTTAPVPPAPVTPPQRRDPLDGGRPEPRPQRPGRRTEPRLD